MGIDPGTNYMGYGVLEIDGRSVRSVVLGDIDLHKLSDPYVKLRYIFERVGALIDQYAPREVALESPFFGENVQSMLKLGRAQGVAMAAALSRGLPVSEYAPMRIKQSITGRGSAAKEQVAAIVCRILSLEQPPKRLDAKDWAAARRPYRKAAPKAGRNSSGSTPTGRSSNRTANPNFRQQPNDI